MQKNDMEKIQIYPKIDFHENRFLMFVIDDMANNLEYKQGKKVIRLTLGKSELKLNPEIVDAMKTSLDDERKRNLVYPGGLPELKEKLADHYHKEFGVSISPDHFIISAGTSSIFRNLFYLLTNSDTAVLLPHPYYSLYRFSALLTGTKIRYYKIDPYTGRLDLKSFRDNFDEKVKAVVLNSPGNPLGNVLTDEEIYQMDEIVDGKAVMISDEIYSNTYFDQANKSALNLQNTKSKFIITNAFSKSYRMYSRRVGFCIVPDELIEPMTVLQHHTLLTLDPVVQYGAIKALDNEEDVRQLTKIYKERRDYTMEKLKTVARVKAFDSLGGFYITLQCGEYMKQKNYTSSYDLAVDLLLKKSVAVVPGSDFGLPETIRLSFTSKNYEEGIDRICEFFRS